MLQRKEIFKQQLATSSAQLIFVKNTKYTVAPTKERKGT